MRTPSAMSAIQEDENPMPGVPRWQSGRNPQHLAVTLFGDFWLARPEFLPSAALIRLLGDLSVSLPSARASLGRLSRRGVTESRRQGRHTYYRLTKPVARDAVEVGAGIMNLGSSHPWSGQWTMCMFSLPASRRETRNQLRTRLKMLGFATVYDGVWASPVEQVERASSVLDELDVDGGSVFTSVEHPAPGRTELSSAWDLDELRGHYSEFLQAWEWVPDVLDGGLLSTKEAFVIRTLLTDSYRRFLKLDPGLPDETLPQGWPRSGARDLFWSCYDGLAGLAALRVQQVVAEQSQELAALVHTHTTEQFVLGDEGVRSCTKCVHFDHWIAP
ncbi:PaaX family transcriptional regulator C-terminal domain-containing protein [Arthrobacter terricola]|uniref:PaaX family transcriptional regulator n=2 Tax=Arthrobacter terricola TaxID=2547396 RepID=A0A4R5L1A1_9MICC|nr:PaaX family transcriptional regulator [Arthrobacter sp. GN70]TDG01308.1 PaaX family transcriptional regulator [Arthrobacter terricola]